MIRETDRVSVVGLGKLGFGLALSFAGRGFNVIGVDTNKKVIDTIKRGRSHIVEPNVEDVLRKVKNRFHVTADHREAIKESDATFILVATPSDSNGNFSNSYVEDALKSLAQSFGESKKKYHLFIVSSTVMPGSIHERLIPIIERYSGRKLNEDFGVCHVPDFVALGSVIDDFQNPDFVLIGESDSRAGQYAEALYRRMVRNDPPFHRLSIVNAEIAKVALNTYITMKISFANLLGHVCENVPGGDADYVTRAIGSDRRIGHHYFKTGLSFGGTCFPRDTKAFISFAKKVGADPRVIHAVHTNNDVHHDRLLKLVEEHLKKDKSKKVTILGLAFKPNTAVVEASPAIELIERLLLRQKDALITVYDPLANSEARRVFGSRIRYASTLGRALRASPLWVVMTPDKMFKEMSPSVILRPTTIIDCWRILRDRFEKEPRVTYRALGVGYM